MWLLYNNNICTVLQLHFNKRMRACGGHSLSFKIIVSYFVECFTLQEEVHLRSTDILSLSLHIYINFKLHS